MNQEFIKLNTGVEIPLVGFGVFQLRNEEECVVAVKTAIETGYTHIDTAAIYQNEEFVGRAIKESGVKREDLFLTTKVWNSVQREFIKDDKAVERAFEESLKKLGTDYVDLYLVHWPVPNEAPGSPVLEEKPYVKTWQALEGIYKSGAAKAIGVCNFNISHLEDIKKIWQVTPAVNQVEIQPYFSQRELVEFGEGLGIIAQAWSPLGGNPNAEGVKKSTVLNDNVLTEIAKNHGKSTAQIIIRWNVQKGVIVLPKSATPSRIKENFNVFDFKLSPEEMAKIDALNTNTRPSTDPAQFHTAF